MILKADDVQKLRELAAGMDKDSLAFGVIGADIVEALCEGWLADDAFDPYDYDTCCCGECV